MKSIKHLFFIFVFLLVTGCNNQDNQELIHIQFVDTDGIVLAEYDKSINEEITYPNINLNKKDQYNNYEFNSWNLVTNEDQNVIYQATYNVTTRLYKITFDGGDGILASGKEVQYLPYGETPTTVIYEKEMHEFIGFDLEVEPASKDVTYTAQYKELKISKITSMELIKNINAGYNYVGGEREDNDHGAIFDSLLAKGINSISLSINWFQNSDENYRINDEFLLKVKTIVDAAIERDMYVILSSYDNYQDRWSSLNYDNYDKLMKIIDVQVGQIGEYFIDYDEHLLISFMNEPRDYSNNSGYSKEAAHILNDASKAFVEKIRSQGYNNKYRHLLITTIWSSFSKENIKYIRFPEDERVILSLHNYAPFGLVHDDTYDEVSWTQNEAAYQIELLSDMKTIYDNYLSKGIPVLMTEFGSRNKNNDIERAKWLEFYLSSAYNYGIKCYIWGSWKSDFLREFSFEVINRNDYTWYSEEIESVYEKLFVKGDFLHFYKEAVNTIHYLDDEVIFLDYMEDLLTGEAVQVEIDYDESFFKTIDGKYYAIRCGETVFSITVDNYTYYFQMTVLPSYHKIVSNFELTSRLNTEGFQQCYIETNGYDISRLKYDWYSSDEEVVKIDKYSTITIFSDGIVGIIAIHKETGAIGVVELEIVNGEIISINSLYEK